MSSFRSSPGPDAGIAARPSASSREHAGLDGGSQQVVGRSDGVDIAGQVKVELVHGNDLAIATAGRTALDAEGRTLAGLADIGKRWTSKVCSQGLSKAHGGC